MKTKPYEHQSQAVKFLEAHPQGCLFMEMGTGKTRVVLERLENMFDLRQALVLAPLSVCQVWVDEIQKHTEFDWCNAAVGNKEVAIKLLQSFARIHILNYDMFRTLANTLPSTFWEKYNCIVADESTVIKNMKAIITRRMGQIFYMTPYKIAMTGTPVTQHALDLWSQLYFVDGGRTLGRNFYRFRDQYFQSDYMKWRWYPKEGGIEQLLERLKHVAFFAKKADCLTLPPKIYTVRYADMTEQQLAVYKNMHDNFMAEVGDKFIETPWVLVQLLRLRQIANGWIDLEGEKRTLSSMKCDLLRQTLAEIPGQKVVVWASFLQDIFNIEKMLISDNHSRYFAIVTGATPPEERVNLIRIWKESADGVLVCQVDVGKFGLDLSEGGCSYAIYFSSGYSVATRLQSEDRLHRIGQTKSATYIDLLTRGTVDEIIYSALQEKKEFIDYLRENGVKKTMEANYLWE